MSAYRRTMLVMAAVLVAAAAPTLAAPRGGQEFSFDVLSVEQGLSNSTVNHITQDAQGFLWIATTDGLNRFDGHQLTIFRHDPLDPGSLAGNWVNAVVIDPRRRLWVLFGIGGVDLFDPDTERFRHFRTGGDPDALPHDRITAMATGADGALWFGTPIGVFSLVESDAEPLRVGPLVPLPPVTALHGGATELWIGTVQGLRRLAAGGAIAERVALPGEGASGHPITQIAEDDDGRLWVGTATAGLFCRGAADTVWSPVGGLRDDHVREIALDPSGVVWVRVAGGSIDRYAPGDDTVLPLDALPGFPDGQLPPFGSMLATDGLLLAGTSGGLLIADTVRGAMRFVRHETGGPAPLSNNAIAALYADRSGILWIGTAGGGVNKLDQRSLQFHHTRVPADDPNAQHVLALHEAPDGTLWIGTAAGLYLERGGRWRRARHDPDDPSTLSADHVSAIVADDHGTLWLATACGLDEVVRSDDPETVVRVRRHAPGGRRVPINGIAASSGGVLWLATGSGLVRTEPARNRTVWYEARPGDAHALPSNLVQLAYVDRQGTVWAGTYIGGLSRYRPGTDDFESFTFQPGVTDGINNLSVITIFEDSAERFWVGTYSGGLNLLDRTTGRFEHVTEHAGLSGNKVNAVLEDRSGALWISTNQGLTRFDPRRRTCATYDRIDGLQSNEFLERSAFATTGGELLFGGIGGLNRFVPETIRSNRSPPPLALTAFKRFDERVPLGSVMENGAIRLAHDDSFISFEFVALDFTNPRKNRYAYMLEGFDDDWIACGTRRYAAYTNLDPGRYVFRVRGANSDGVWNDAGLSLGLLVLPPFWQRPLFYWLVGGALLALMVLAHLYWVRVKVRQSIAIERARFVERERVREQVARDYHDELGHKLTKISLFTELLKRHMNGDRQQLATYVAKVADFADSLSRDARDFIWALNPHQDSLYDVGVYLQDFGTSLFDDAGSRFHVHGLSRELATRQLSSDRKRHLILIFKEAMTNALRHAAPENVTLRFGQQNGGFEVTLEDDGVGFEAAGRLGGNGLDNMRRRSQHLGGELHIESGAGGGTRVSFRGA